MAVTYIRRLAALALLASAAVAAPLAIGDAAAQRIERFDPGRPPAGVTGKFDYYVLSLSWSPTYCAEQGGRGEDQCRPRPNRPFAFVLHGLWPQYERGYPEFCASRDRPFVPQGVIDRMLDVMPARGLIIHQYRKHGTCSGLEPGAYFDAARRYYQKVKIPQRFANADRDQVIERSAVVADFIAANPGLKPEHMAVTCGGSGNRLREVRICMTRDGEFRSCGANEDQNRLCRSPRVYVPPVRYGGGARPDRAPPARSAPPGGVRNL